MSVLEKRIVFLNGPPSSGKDEIAKIMAVRYNFTHLKFADVIKDIVCAALSLDRKTLETIKDVYDARLQMTMREFLIWLSEDCFKPKFGNGVFGEWTVNKLKTYASGRIIFSDSGFFEEFYPVAYANYHGKNLVLEIHRPGHDFTNDSRSYWWGPNEAMAKRIAKWDKLDNNRTIKYLRAAASKKICTALDLEWDEQWTPLD